MILKYIATYDLTGVLQPILRPELGTYVPKRQFQKALMLLVTLCMLCMTSGIVSCGHRVHIEATSIMSIAATPLLLPLDVMHALSPMYSWFNSLVSGISPWITVCV